MPDESCSRRWKSVVVSHVTRTCDISEVSKSVCYLLLSPPILLICSTLFIAFHRLALEDGGGPTLGRHQLSTLCLQVSGCFLSTVVMCYLLIVSITYWTHFLVHFVRVCWYSGKILFLCVFLFFVGFFGGGFLCYQHQCLENQDVCATLNRKE